MKIKLQCYASQAGLNLQYLLCSELISKNIAFSSIT